MNEEHYSIKKGKYPSFKPFKGACLRGFQFNGNYLLINCNRILHDNPHLCIIRLNRDPWSESRLQNNGFFGKMICTHSSQLTYNCEAITQVI